VIFSILVVLTNQYVHSNSSDQNNQYGAVPDYDQSGATRRRARRCPMFFVLVASLVMMDCAWPESGQPVTGADAQLEDRFLHGVTGIADQVYATPAGFRPLTLDLYLPAKQHQSECVRAFANVAIDHIPHRREDRWRSLGIGLADTRNASLRAVHTTIDFFDCSLRSKDCD
jgi:hypothetical protein